MVKHNLLQKHTRQTHEFKKIKISHNPSVIKLAEQLHKLTQIRIS